MSDPAHAVVDTALRLAEESDWESVRLYRVAAELGVSLDRVRHFYREKEDLVDAWFDRADAAMLKAADSPGFCSMSDPERLHVLLMAWLDALSTHRIVTRQMILGKLEPGHIHYQFNGLMRVSRTVQWWREAAGRTAALPVRALEEATLTALYLATFVYWMYDESEGGDKTRVFLDKRLEQVFGTGCSWCAAAEEKTP